MADINNIGSSVLSITCHIYSCMCFRRCDWFPWGNWGSCGSQCGATHTRTRSLCCKEDDTFEICREKCGLSQSPAYQSGACPLKCVFGYNSGRNCVCNAQHYGTCCQYSEYEKETEKLKIVQFYRTCIGTKSTKYTRQSTHHEIRKKRGTLK